MIEKDKSRGSLTMLKNARTDDLINKTVTKAEEIAAREPANSRGPLSDLVRPKVNQEELKYELPKTFTATEFPETPEDLENFLGSVKFNKWEDADAMQKVLEEVAEQIRAHPSEYKGESVSWEEFTAKSFKNESQASQPTKSSSILSLLKEQTEELSAQKPALDDDFYKGLTSALMDKQVLSALTTHETVGALETLACEARKEFLKAKRKLLILDKVVEKAHKLLEDDFA